MICKKLLLTLAVKAHLKESLDWKLATPRGKMQGDRLKLLVLFTYLKCRLCHCCLAVAPCFTQHGKPKSSRWPWSALCALNTQGCTSFPTCSPCLPAFQLHGLSTIPLAVLSSQTRAWLIPSLFLHLCSAITFSVGSPLTALFHMETSPPVYLSPLEPEFRGRDFC